MRSGVQFVETVPERPASARRPANRSSSSAPASGPQPNRSASAAAIESGERPWSAACSGGPEAKTTEKAARVVDGRRDCLHEPRDAARPPGRELRRDPLVRLAVAERRPGGGMSSRLGILAEERAAGCAEALRSRAAGQRSESGSSASVSVYDGSQAGIEARLEVDSLGAELRGNVAGERGDVLDRLGRRGAQAVPRERAVEQARGGVGVRGAQLVVVEAYDPGAEAKPRTVARLAEAQQLCRADAARARASRSGSTAARRRAVLPVSTLTRR